MKRTKIVAYALAFFMGFGLMSCEGTNDENASNEMQDGNSEPTARQEPGSRGLEASTDLEPVGDGETDASKIEPFIGGREMMPSQNIVENITSNVRLTQLASIIKKAEFVNALNATGPHTVFTPTNEAFEALPGNTIEDLMKEENRAQLETLLKNHVVAGQLTAAQLQDGSTLKTLGGAQLKVSKQGNKVMVNGAEVQQADAMSKNGVIHIINKVLTVNQNQ